MDEDNWDRNVVEFYQPRYLEVQLLVLPRVELDWRDLKQLVALALDDEVLYHVIICLVQAENVVRLGRVLHHLLRYLLAGHLRLVLEYIQR